jgi:hypothetical protein
MPDEIYEPFASVVRITGATEKLDHRIAEVLALHFALEREMDVLLGQFVKRPEKLASLGFINKAKVIYAVWPGPTDKAEAFLALMTKFNDVRNAFAHSDAAGIEKCHQNLIATYAQIDPLAPEDLSYTQMALVVCMVMHDGPLPGEIRLLFQAIGQLLSEFAKMFSAVPPIAKQ